MLLMSKLNDNEAHMAEDNPTATEQKKQPNRRSIVEGEKKISEMIAQADAEIARLLQEVRNVEGERSGLLRALDVISKSNGGA